MDLSQYLEGLRRDLTAAAAPGGPDVSRAADLLTGALEPSARLCLLEALSDAAAEITTHLPSATVEVRLRGREAELVVSDAAQFSAPAPSPPGTDSGDLARITLRLPEPLKEHVERAASAEGISVNAWLVRAVAAAVHHAMPGPGQPSGPSDMPGMPGRPGMPAPPRPPRGRRITGFAQA